MISIFEMRTILPEAEVDEVEREIRDDVEMAMGDEVKNLLLQDEYKALVTIEAWQTIEGQNKITGNGHGGMMSPRHPVTRLPVSLPSPSHARHSTESWRSLKDRMS